jgi:hypothetical protein
MGRGTPKEAAMATWTVEEPRRLSLDGSVDRLDVKLAAAKVNVVGDDGPARVEVTRVGRRPLIVEHEHGVLRVRHEKPPHWSSLHWWLSMLGRQGYDEVSIAVPRQTPSALRVAAGSVVASGLRAGVDLHVASGQVTMLGLDGAIRARVTSGSIEALGLSGDLSMDVTSGEMTMADSAARRVSASVVSGRLTCDLDNPHGSDIRLQTISGEITVRIREDSDLDVHLQATSGRLSTNFTQLHPQGLTGVRNAHGRLGAGTGQLHATAVSGNIALLSRPVDTEMANGELA